MEDRHKQISLCRQIRDNLDVCLNTSQLLNKECMQMSKAYSDLCYRNAARSEPKSFVFGLNPRQYGLPKMKVK